MPNLFQTEQAPHLLQARPYLSRSLTFSPTSKTETLGSSLTSLLTQCHQACYPLSKTTLSVHPFPPSLLPLSQPGLLALPPSSPATQPPFLKPLLLTDLGIKPNSVKYGFPDPLLSTSPTHQPVSTNPPTPRSRHSNFLFLEHLSLFSPSRPHLRLAMPRHCHSLTPPPPYTLPYSHSYRSQEA